MKTIQKRVKENKIAILRNKGKSLAIDLFIGPANNGNIC